MTDNRTTELLRRLLDERGVEHYDGTESTLWLKDEHGYRASADELSSGRLSVHIWCDTPEQAIAATLGSGMCEPKWTLQGKTQTQEFWRCECGNCGECFGVEDRSSFPFNMTIDKVDIPNFCPNCGKRVAE